MTRKTIEPSNGSTAAIDKGAAHLKGMTENPPHKMSLPVQLFKLDIQQLRIRLVGDSDLICHQWSEKAKKIMLDGMLGRASKGKSPKDPQQDYLDSLYIHRDGWYGFPALAFKKAAVTACTSLSKAVTKVAARQAFHVVGELVQVEGEPYRREDMVKLAMNKADIRYRGAFNKWAVNLDVRYNVRAMSAEQIVNLFNTAGFAVGVGEWRPERDGAYGLFHVAGGADR